MNISFFFDIYILHFWRFTFYIFGLLAYRCLGMLSNGLHRSVISFLSTIMTFVNFANKTNGRKKMKEIDQIPFTWQQSSCVVSRLLVELSVYYHWMRVTEIFGFAFEKEKKIVVWLRFVNWSILEYNGPKSYTMNRRLKRRSEKVKFDFQTFKI